MRKAIIIAVASLSFISAGATTDSSDDKSRIKYLEIEGIESTERIPMGDVDKIWITMSTRYPLMFRPVSVFYGSTSFMFDPRQNERIDFRFIPADNDEILPPVLTEFSASGLNSVNISWCDVSDAIGYELRYVKQWNEADEKIDWDNEQACDGKLVFDQNSNCATVENLQYGATYRFAIRTLGVDGNVSEWSERLPNFKDNKDFKIPTAYRATPRLITGITDKTSDGFKVKFNLDYNRNNYPEACADSIERYYAMKDGKFVADKIRIENLNTGQKSYITLTEKMLSDGEIVITNLEGNNHYEVTLMNSLISTEADAVFDIVNVDSWLTLNDYIQTLGPDYSQFKQWYEDNHEAVFDRSKSYVIGARMNMSQAVNYYEAVYDSVFTKTKPMFGKKGFNPESSTDGFTLLLPTDDIIDAAIADAKARLRKWDLERDEEMLKDWVFGVLLFDEIIPMEMLTAEVLTDYESVFGCKYRTSAQKVSGSVTELHNGVIYPLASLYIPDNALIYRLKDEFRLYEDCTDEMKKEYFKMTNMELYKVDLAVAAWSPLEGIWPMHENVVLKLRPSEDGDDKPFRLDFTPVHKVKAADGGEEVVPFLIPPGSYRLAFGSKQNQNITITTSVYVGGECVATSPEPILLGTSTAYHYDRGTTLPNRYPYGYDVTDVRNAGGSSKSGNYDTDGGLLIEEVVVPDLYGDGRPVPIMIRFEGDNWNRNNDFTFNHWCLRPTADFY